MIRLYIENNEIDLDQNVQFAITKQFEELSNPTIIINDWSKTVSIPFTTHNHSVFGHIYSPDKVTVAGSGMGIYFDPLKKLDFRLEWDSTVLMSGYAKMNEIKLKDGSGTYELTLFGQLGKLFQEMKKITFDVTTEDTDYLIDGSKYVDEYIDRNIVYDSWRSNGQLESEIKDKYTSRYNPTTGQFETIPNPAYRVTDLIGFAPNNSFCEGFDYKTYLTSTASMMFKTTLGDLFRIDTGINAETAIPNGLLPREIGEYRSYHLLPYIYWNKLFKIFQKKAETLTGYKFELDSTFFNTSNPDWYNIVYMLKSFVSAGQTNEPNYINTYNFWLPSPGFLAMTSADYSVLRSSGLGATIVNENKQILDEYQGTGYDFNFSEYSGTITFNIPFQLRFLSYGNYYQNTYLNPANGLIITIKAIDVDTSEELSKTDYLFCRTNATISTTGYLNVIRYDTASTGYSTNPLKDKMDFSIVYTSFIPRGHKVQFEFQCRCVNNNHIFEVSLIWLPLVELYLLTNQMNIKLSDEIRSNSHFILNDLWNNDYNLYEEVIKYCKMMRIFIYANDAEKKLYFTPVSKFFENYSILDWSEKIDKSKDYLVKPVTFENKYIIYNYDDNKVRLNDNYKEKYGFNFGEYKLVTDYNFNNEKQNLFNGIKCPIVNTDNVLSWNNLHNNHLIIYSFPAELFVSCKDKDNKFIDLFGTFYYHNGVNYFSTEAIQNLRDVYISDDTALQSGNNTFFYSQGGGSIKRVYTYPHLNVVKGNNLFLFNVPKLNFTYVSNYSGKKTIYTRYWQNYINERYNVQNKKVTCYLKLTQSDWNNFSFNNFVKINNLLYIVNKIYDYNITENSTTKVDLITMQDVSAYTTNNFS